MPASDYFHAFIYNANYHMVAAVVDMGMRLDTELVGRLVVGTQVQLVVGNQKGLLGRACGTSLKKQNIYSKYNSCTYNLSRSRTYNNSKHTC